MPRTLTEAEFEAVKAKVLASAPPQMDEANFTRWVGPAMAQALGEAENTPAPATSALGDSAPGRFAASLYRNSPIPAAVNLVGGAANVVAHPLDTYFGLKPAAETLVGAAKAQWDQAVQAAQKAKEATRGGGALSASEALGHGLAAVLPILGPAAAQVGEQGARGDVAGMAGGAVGLLGPFAVKYGLELKHAPDPQAADLLRRSAEQQVSERVLAPGNVRYKGTAQQVAPEMLSREMQGTRLELQQLADEGMTKAADAIDAVIAKQGPPAQHLMDVKPISQALQDRIDEFTVNGETIPTATGKVQQLTKIKDFLDTKVGNTATFADLKRMRDDFYRAAAEAKGYQFQSDTGMADLGWAAREAGSAIREAFAQAHPDLVGPNADYTFYRRLGDVLDPALGRPKAVNAVTSGATGGLATAGAVIGQAASSVPGVRALSALATANLLPKIKAALNSPEYQLASAAKKMRLADAIERGDVGAITSVLSTISPYAPREQETPTP